MKPKYIELCYTADNGRREIISFQSIKDGKKELKTGKYQDAVLDVHYADKEGELDGCAFTFYILRNGKILNGYTEI